MEINFQVNLDLEGFVQEEPADTQPKSWADIFRFAPGVYRFPTESGKLAVIPGYHQIQTETGPVYIREEYLVWRF